METNVFQEKTRIMVVDDHPLIRIGLEQVVSAEASLFFCGQAETVAAARAAVKECLPDLVIVDLGLPDGDGLELIKELKTWQPSLRILVLSQFDETIYAERALRAGASGYLMKDVGADRILAAIFAVRNGDIHVSPKVALLALNMMAAGKAQHNHGSLPSLTNRELHVLQLLGCGLNSRQVAAKLEISQKTVETHRENIKHKLGLCNAAELIHYAGRLMDGQSLPANPVPARLQAA